LLAAYAMLPEQYRFSRAIILFGALLAFVLTGLIRLLLIKLNVLNSDKKKEEQLTTVIVGAPSEYNEVVQLLKEAGVRQRILGRVAINENEDDAVGYYKNAVKLSTMLPFREIIFCRGELTFSAIIESMQQLPLSVTTRIHTVGSTSIVGSNSKDSSGEAVSKENGFKLSDPYNRRIKRLIDVSVAIAAIITFPVHLFLVKKPISFLGNCFKVLFVQKTWIGYAVNEKNLPLLYTPVITCNGLPASVKQNLPNESLQMMDYWYARDYDPSADLKMILIMYRHLGD
jgi:hypothetical protein